MKSPFYILILVALCCVTIAVNFSTKKGKFWDIGLIRFENSVCKSINNLDGTCYTKWQCKDVNGFESGRCAQNIAVCCVIQYTCGDISPYNNTYFVSPNFPNQVTDGQRCVMTIQRCSDDICQVRLDFLSLTLAQPNGEGICAYDALTITGGGSQVPIICGENSGQHVYVEFNGNDTIQLTITTTAGMTIGRSWNIKVTQIACACPTRAPSGCLMYYTTLTGTVRSFNYGRTASSDLTPNGTIGTRELANENYGVCIAQIPGYCAIEWSQCSGDSFTVSGDTIANSEILGNPVASVQGMNCTTDFVIIPNPYYTNGMAVNSDRFCGNALPTVISRITPFVLYVVTNGNELEGQANRGFCLNYRELGCTPLGGFANYIN